MRRIRVLLVVLLSLISVASFSGTALATDFSRTDELIRLGQKIQVQKENSLLENNLNFHYIIDKVQADKDKEFNIGTNQITELNTSINQENIWGYIKAQSHVGKEIEISGDSLNSSGISESTSGLNGSITESEPNSTLSSADTILLDYAIFGTITNYYYDLDYYRLQVSQSGELTIVGAWMGNYLNYGWEDDLAIVLIDSNGNTLKWSDYFSFDDGTACQYLQYNISPGMYYIVVFQSSDYHYLYVGEPYGFSAQMEVQNVQAVSLNKSSTTLTIGNTETLTVTVTPANATNKNVTWSSNHPEIATVSNGVVTPVSPGTATITVTTVDGGFTAQCDVTVVPPVVNVPSVQTTNMPNITINSAVLNGSITSNGGGTIIEYGFYWGATSNPATKVVVGTDDKSGTFTSTLSGLSPGTTYYFKAYAVNSAGIGYGDIMNFTTGTGGSQTVLSAPDMESGPGNTIQIPINLSSQGNVSGIQFELHYDSSLLTFTTGTFGTLDPGFNFTANSSVTGKVTVVIFSMTAATMPTGEDSIALFTFQVSSGAQPGQSCPLVLSNVALSEADGNSLAVSLVNGSFTVKSFTKGDVNGDGNTNVQDVVRTVNIILGKVTPTENENYAADANSDNKINVQDVVRIVNIILGKA